MKRAAILMMAIMATTAIAQTNSSDIVQRMKEIIIPSIEFRNANGMDILLFLIEASNADIPDHQPTTSIGLMITNAPAVAHIYKYELDDGSNIDIPVLTMEYRRISLFDALNRVTESLGMTYKIEGDQVSFFTKDGKRIIRK